MANTIELSMSGSTAVLCQITSVTCYFLAIFVAFNFLVVSTVTQYAYLCLHSYAMMNGTRNLAQITGNSKSSTRIRMGIMLYNTSTVPLVPLWTKTANVCIHLVLSA